MAHTLLIPSAEWASVRHPMQSKSQAGLFRTGARPHSRPSRRRETLLTRLRSPTALLQSANQPLARLSRVALLVAGVDLLTKFVAARLWSAEAFHITQWLSLSLVQNHGGAFGWSAGVYTWQLNLALTLAAVVFVIPVTRDLAQVDRHAPLALGLIVGGALGNLASLVVPPSGVSDFIAVRLSQEHSVVLNLADVAAYSGLALILRTGFRIAATLVAQTGAAARRERLGSAFAVRAKARSELQRIRVTPAREVLVADWDHVSEPGVIPADAPEPPEGVDVVQTPPSVPRPLGRPLGHHSGIVADLPGVVTQHSRHREGTPRPGA